MAAAFEDTYEIVSLIGRGGMSSVYLARHKRLGTRWAVKEVPKNQTASFDFLAESNILKRLSHPMLPRIVDIFEDDRRVLLVEDYVEGITLADLLKERGKVGEEEGLPWFRELCSVLDYLHSQKPHPIIYRDLKPSNIMLQPDGALKLIDFGIAREYKQDSQGDTAYIGTKGYAAPEQFGAAQTDARTDIYSLGVTMYHLLTGKSPYEPPYQFVPARELNASLSRGMEYILSRCVQPEPEDRYPDVKELLDDLLRIYRFDDAYKKYRRAKVLRAALVIALAAASLALMAGGRFVMAGEREERYVQLLSQAESLRGSDLSQSVSLLEEAQALFPQRPEAYRQQAYALYLDGDWQGCCDFAARALELLGEDSQLRVTMASAQFELRDYEAAAQGFAQGGELSEDHLREYAVCLGRLGDIQGAEAVLSELTGRGARPDATAYVRGEVAYAQGDYTGAEACFLEALEEARSEGLLRRCYLSLADVYQACADLETAGGSPIEQPATKAAALLAQAVSSQGFGYDSALWEALAMACYNAAVLEDAPDSYLERAAEAFQRVIDLGVSREYLYANLYAIYYTLGDAAAASGELDAYEAAFPASPTPNALRGILLIQLENEKPQEQRDYSPVLAQYEQAAAKAGSSGDGGDAYYYQLEALVEELREKGWL